MIYRYRLLHACLLKQRVFKSHLTHFYNAQLAFTIELMLLLKVIYNNWSFTLAASRPTLSVNSIKPVTFLDGFFDHKKHQHV